MTHLDDRTVLDTASAPGSEAGNSHEGIGNIAPGTASMRRRRKGRRCTPFAVERRDVAGVEAA